MSELKTSEEWNVLEDYVVLNPDGWDRQNFRYSWFEEIISLEEFNKRIHASTIFRDN